MKAGMRAKEIAAVTWAMVTDADGVVGDAIALENRASKGRSGRLIPLHPRLRDALVERGVDVCLTELPPQIAGWRARS